MEEDIQGKRIENNNNYQELPAVKPRRVNWIWNEFQCGNCHEFYGDDEHRVQTLRYCPHCGRAIDWSDIEIPKYNR